MHICFALVYLFIFNFINAQHSVTSASQELYDMLKYPADANSKILFEQAKLKLSKNMQDEDAKSTLAMLAERSNPYIPALRFQVGVALADKRFQDAWRLADTGARAGDLSCKFAKATFLLNPTYFFCDAEYDPLLAEIHGQNLLFEAAQEVPLPSLHPKRFWIAKAKEYLEELQDQAGTRLRTAFELSLNKKSKQELAQVEALAKEEYSFVEGCYFLKKYISGDDRLDASDTCTQIVEWADRIICHADFDYEEFKKSGAYAALESFALRTEYPEHARASFLLGYIDAQRLLHDESIDLVKLERNLEAGSAYNITALLMLANHAATIEDKFDYLHRIVQQLDTIQPELYTLITPSLIRQYHFMMQNKERNFSGDLVQLLKHNAFKTIRDQLCKDSLLAAELGMKLLQIRDYMVDHAESKDRAEHRRIRDVGIAFINASAADGNDQAAWALVEHSLQLNAPDAQKKALDTHVANAVIAVERSIQKKSPLLVDIEVIKDSLKKLVPSVLSSDTNSALAHWHLNGVPGVIERDELKAVRHLAVASENSVLVVKAQEESKLNDARACFEAALILHKNSPQLHKDTRTLLFSKALLHADLALKKEIINYCLDHEELVSQGITAMTAYQFSLIPLATNVPKEEMDFYHQACKKIFKWASGCGTSDIPDINKRHKEAIMYFHDWRMLDKKHPGALSNPEAVTNILELTEWAASQEYEPALDALADEFTNIESDLDYQRRAIIFWEAWLNHYALRPEKAQETKNAYEIVETLSALSSKMDENMHPVNPDFRSHYRLANIFMNRDPERTMDHLALGEMCMRSQGPQSKDLKNLIVKTGTLDRVRLAAQKGQEWANYALAAIKLGRINSNFIEENYTNPEKCFEEVEEIRQLIKKAGSYVPARARNYVNQLCDVNFAEAYVADEILKRTPGDNPKLDAKCDSVLEVAIESGSPDARFMWADKALTGKYGNGQEVIDKIIDRLCEAARIGSTESSMVLSSIDKQGFDCYFEKLNGTVTKVHREKLIAHKDVITRPLLVVPEPEKDTFAYAHYWLNRLENIDQVRAIFERESAQGNICAHVYLGVMCRDGIGVEQSTTRAQEYFARAIRESKGKKITTDLYKTLLIARSGLRGTQNIDNLLAVLRFDLQTAAQIEAEKTADLLNPLLLDSLDKVEEMEKIVISSQNSTTYNDIYTSGVMEELVRVSASTKVFLNRLRIARICANRLTHISPKSIVAPFSSTQDDKHKNGNFSLLIAPFDYLGDMLDEIVTGLTPVNHRFSKLIIKEVREFTSVLEPLVAKGYLIPLEQILGSLLVCDGIFTQDPAQIERGMKHWLNADKNGDQRAGYVYGIFQVKGSSFVPCKSQFVTRKVKRGEMIQGYKQGDIIQYVKQTELVNWDAKAGLAKLKSSADKGYAQSACMLGKYALEDNDSAAAATYYRQAYNVSPKLDLATYGLLKTFSINFAHSTETEKKLIPEFIATVKNGSRMAFMVPLFTAYFSLVHSIGQTSPDVMVDAILEVTREIYAQKNAETAAEFMQKTDFLTHFGRYVQESETAWKDPQNQKNLDSDMIMLKKYTAQAILEYLYGTRYESSHMNTMRILVNKCCKILSENKLDLNAVQALGNLLHTIAEHGAIAGADITTINGSIIVTAPKKLNVVNDQTWAQKIIEKYKPVS